MSCKISSKEEIQERFGLSFWGEAMEGDKKYVVFYMDHISYSIADFRTSFPIVGEVEEEYNVEVNEGRYTVSDPDRGGLTSVVKPKTHKAKLYVITWDLTEGKEPIKLYYLTNTASMFNMHYISTFIQSEIKILDRIK